MATLAKQQPQRRHGWSAEAVSNGGRFPRRREELNEPQSKYQQDRGHKAARSEAAKCCNSMGPAAYLRGNDRDAIEQVCIALDSDGEEGAWVDGYIAGLKAFRADLHAWETDEAAEARLQADGVRLNLRKLPGSQP